MRVCVDELPESMERCPFAASPKWEGKWVFYCALSKEPLKCNFNATLNECRGVYTMPTIKPKQGEWIGDKCSICGNERAWYGCNPPYCPDCGSQMKGEDDETD